jgi:beta-1,3-galactosyltransferase 1
MSRLQETTFPAIQDTKRIKLNISEVPFITSHPYVMSNTNMCRSSKELTLIILIHSAPSHFGHRSVIRNTWANINNFHVKFNFRRVFLFGKVSNHELQARLEDEHMINGDILQGDFDDGYRNLSLNTLFGLAWVYEHCSNAEVVMKVDDDIVVDMYNLFPRIVMRMSFVTNHVFCNRLHNEPIERNKRLKYFVSENELKGKSVFPPYCEGKVVIFTSDLVHQILNVASNTPVFWLEDVYMYGLVLNQIPNLTFDIYRFGDEMDIWCDDTTKCVTTDSTCRKLFVEIRKTTSTLIENIWKMFQQRHVSCAVL